MKSISVRSGSNALQISCRYCGDHDTTLYKDGDRYICAKCKYLHSDENSIKESDDEDLDAY